MRRDILPPRPASGHAGGAVPSAASATRRPTTAGPSTSKLHTSVSPHFYFTMPLSQPRPASALSDASSPATTRTNFTTAGLSRQERSALLGSASDAHLLVGPHRAAALEALDHTLSDSSFSNGRECVDKVIQLRQQLNAHAADLGAQTSVTAEGKMATYRTMLDELLAPHPNIKTFVKSVMAEYERYIGHLKRESDTSAAEVLRSSLFSTQKALTEANARIGDLEENVQQLETVVDTLRSANADYANNQSSLEAYVSELRTTLATYANHVLQRPGGDADLVPHDSPESEQYVTAIRKMAAEIESLRLENVKLCTESIEQVDEYNALSTELTVMIDRANDFQTQVGQLKSTVKNMNAHIDELEAKQEVLAAIAVQKVVVTRDKQRLELQCESAQRSLALARAEALFALSCKMPASLTVPAITELNAGTVVATIPAEVPAQKGDATPAHLVTGTKTVRLRTTMKVSDALDLVHDALAAARVVATQKPPQLRAPFASLVRDVLRKKFGTDKAAVEAAYTLQHLATTLAHHSADFHIFLLMLEGKMVIEGVASLDEQLLALRAKLAALPQVGKSKNKDRILRADFVRCVQETLHPGLDDTHPLQLLLVANLDKNAAGDDLLFEAHLDTTSHTHSVLRLIALSGALELQTALALATVRRLKEEGDVSKDGIERVAAVNDSRVPLRMVLEAMEEVDPHCPEAERHRRVRAGLLANPDAQRDGCTEEGVPVEDYVVNFEEFFASLKKNCHFTPPVAVE